MRKTLRCRECDHKGDVAIELRKPPLAILISVAALLLLVTGVGTGVFGCEVFQRAGEVDTKIILSGKYPVELADGSIGTVATEADLQQTIEGGGQYLTPADLKARRASAVKRRSDDENFAIGCYVIGAGLLFGAVKVFQARRRTWKNYAFCRECNAEIGPIDRLA